MIEKEYEELLIKILSILSYKDIERVILLWENELLPYNKEVRIVLKNISEKEKKLRSI